jgi:PAS domain S-box-containing protein
MHAGNTTVVPPAMLRPEDPFQKVLLRFSEAAAQGIDASALLQLFCRETRVLFQVSGTYFWRCLSADQLIGAEADGLFAEQFRGARLKASQSAVAVEAVRTRRTIYNNHVDPQRYPMAGEYSARSIMAAPLVVANEVIGAAAFLHDSATGFFNDDLAAKATILAGQLGSLLEARRLTQASREEHRRAEILAEVANALHGVPDVNSVMEALADRLRALLRTRLVCALLPRDGRLELSAIATETPAMATSIRAHYDRTALRYAGDLASRAISAGEAITATINPAAHGLGDLVPAGMLIAAPLRTTRAQGAILVYPRAEGGFSTEEKSLVAAVTGFGAVAIANAELYSTAKAQAEDLHQLLEISSELSRLLHVPDFARRFAARAATLTDAKAAAVFLYQDSLLEIVAYHDTRQRPVPDPATLRRFTHGIRQFLADRQPQNQPGDNNAVAASPQPSRIMTGAECLDSELADAMGWTDCILLPLQGQSEEPVGVLWLANRGKPLGDQDCQLLQAIAAPASVALENARLFTRMEQANRHWMEIFDAISDFIVVHDELHNVLRVNRPWAEFIGVQPGELVGLNMRALVAQASDAPSASCPFCRSGDTEDEYVHPVLERTYLVSTSRIHGDNNENLQTIHVLKDITDRREAERRYRELFDNIQEGLFFSTPDGRFIEVNEAMVRMLGYNSREELLQADIPNQIYFSPEIRQQLAELMEEHGSLRNHEATLRRRDGSPMHVLINAFAVPDAHGRVSQYRGLMLDISGLKSFQAELQRERDFSSKILNHTQSLILVADTAGLISYANRRWFDIGYEQKQLLGKPLAMLVPAPRREALTVALEATIAGHQVDNLDLQVMRGDGRLGQFSVNLSPMRDELGAVTSIVVVMSDVTDAAMLQSKLMHAEKMAAVGQLVSGVAHEVNNPLTAILGFADLLMDNADLPDSARKDLRVILQEAQRTKQIVQNLLSFARQMPPQRKPVQLNGILRRTVQLRSYDFNSHGVEVLEHFDERLPDVIGDSHQLQQVFLNILNNAYDAVRGTGRPARIEIMTATIADFVEVSFKDNGQGIAHPDRIFDPFFTTKEIGKGTGLGLSICYGIVREHGGEILCHNNVGNEGATFLVRLPIASESASSVVAGAGVAQR